MTIRWNNCSKNSPPGGLTLIEVVVGLLLLSTLLAGLLLSFQRHARQIRLARQKLAAVQATDLLLAGWFATPEGFPLEASGSVPGHASLWWETSVKETRLVGSLPVRIVRVLIRNDERARATDEPLVDIELMAPAPVANTAVRGPSG